MDSLSGISANEAYLPSFSLQHVLASLEHEKKIDFPRENRIFFMFNFRILVQENGFFGSMWLVTDKVLGT